ncbi:MAG: AAA family ATPase, partial [Bacteroidales bacterium]|nr:AAA family ATPase [Bacteroidales bacterium]
MARIEPYIGKSIIKVLAGQRRVGKSYILFQIMKRVLKEDVKANIIYINKEDLQFGSIKTFEDLTNYIFSNSRTDTRNYIFIDEIQDIDEFERSLRSLLLDQNN